MGKKGGTMERNSNGADIALLKMIKEKIDTVGIAMPVYAGLAWIWELYKSPTHLSSHSEIRKILLQEVPNVRGQDKKLAIFLDIPEASIIVFDKMTNQQKRELSRYAKRLFDASNTLYSLSKTAHRFAEQIIITGLLKAKLEEELLRLAPLKDDLTVKERMALVWNSFGREKAKKIMYVREALETVFHGNFKKSRTFKQDLSNFDLFCLFFNIEPDAMKRFYEFGEPQKESHLRTAEQKIEMKKLVDKSNPQ